MENNLKFSDSAWSLSEQQVQVWWFELNPPDSFVEPLVALLSEDEITRANRYQFPHLRTRYQVAHGILRILLGNYLNLHPQHIEFIYSDRGKPQLAAHCNPLNLQFNLSHSDNLALVGIGYNQRLGVDVECLRSLKNAELLAQRFFSPTEAKLFKPVNPQTQEQIFFQLWTAKEAYLKATGEGIAGGLDQVEIGLTPLRFLKCPQSPNPDPQWALQSFSIEPDGKNYYLGAIAVEGKIETLSIEQFRYG
ncbi:MAG: 4'-phosphopantetheinyl transferase superfamily protein [Snowella sp.]|nr:4'-phosphopantetheinyl transferase superfamily protein [Snowella sp.]